MRLTYIILIVSFGIPALANGQDPKDLTKYSQSIAIDTSLAPDYFKAEITIGEYFRFNGKGKNRTSQKVILDSVKHTLISELRKLNFTAPIDLIKVTERDGSYKDDKTFQGTYEFIIRSKDSIDILYRNLSQNMPSYSLTRFKISPELTPQRIKQAQAVLERHAKERVTMDAQKFADSNNLKISKIDTYQLGFTKKEKYDTDYYNNQQKAYNITFANPIYSLNTYYVFLLGK